MLKSLLSTLLIFTIISLQAQIEIPKFGEGIINVTAEDSSFAMKMGLRFQNLVIADWTRSENSSFSDADLNFLIRRARLKFNGFAVSPKLTYKVEIGLSNEDIGGGNTSNYSNAPQIMYDAYIRYNFYKNLVLQFGQHKLPGNRERVVSSGDLQFVDRSRLNDLFNIDRDFGIMLRNSSRIGEKVILNQDISVSQGEGRNLTSGNKGGLDYTFRLEALPLGAFESNGDYVSSAIAREARPKLSIGVSYDINVNSVRERGQLGNFIQTEYGYEGKTLYTWFADLIFKYQGLSIMAEYADKRVEDDLPVIVENNGEVKGTYYTGNAFSVQAGYFLSQKNELSLRYTLVNPDAIVDEEELQYTLGFSRFIVGNKLKIQSDITYRDRAISDDNIVFRLQTELHF